MHRTITGRHDLQSLRFLAAHATVLILAFVSASLALAGPSGLIRGTVKTEAGQPVSHAMVIAKDQTGLVLASGTTDKFGHFELLSVKSGNCRVEVHCAHCSETPVETITVSDGAAKDLNIIVGDSNTTRASASDSFGSVNFYTKSDFKSGELTDPSAGGGYSDAASLQAGSMVSQYLAAEPAPSAADIGYQANPNAASSPSEASLESSGRALLARRDFARAISVFEDAVGRYPRSARLQMGLGLSLYGAGNYQEALRALCESTRLVPNDPSPLLLLAEASQDVANPSVEAGRLLKTFSERHPQNTVGHYSYGIYLLKVFRSRQDQQALARAQSELEKAVALDADDSAAHLELGIVYDLQGVATHAMSQYQEAIRLSPGLATAHYRLAQDYERAGENAKAAIETAEYERLRNATPH